jgi:hypothetical protein
MNYRWPSHPAPRALLSLFGDAPTTTIHAACVSEHKEPLNEASLHIRDWQADGRGAKPRSEAMARIRDLNRRSLGAGALLLALSGCSISTTRHGWPGSYAPAGVPNAQNCVPFSFGQPTEFACSGGKVYTAQQLKSLREPKATRGTVASAGY